MLILTIRTDNPTAEIGLYFDGNKIAYESWTAHRRLAETIHQKILEMLKTRGKTWADIEGILFFKGPGSFTGLRIGASVANALANGLGTPIAGTEGNDWTSKGIKRLSAGENDGLLLPVYGAEAHITPPKK